MTDDTRRTALSKLDAIAAARHWLSLGIQPVPLKPKSKRPKLKGWTKFLASAETIEDHFKAGDNIGGLWGEASNGIVDIDLDTLESATIAGVMLPSTFVYGHEDRERTHYLYVCLDATTQKWHDLSGNVILELRSTGSQSVLPPSIHPDGDRYITHDERRFTHISQESLIESLNRVAALSVLAGVYPSGHGRHDFIHSITGALLHSGWNAVDVRTSVIALLAAVSARETDMDQRVRTIDNTIDHFKKGSRVAGWPTLAGMVKADVLELVRRWLSVTEVDEIIPARRPTRRDYVRPVELLETIPAGLVREVAAWAAKYSYAVQPVLSVAVGLMCTALATRNRFVVSGWSTPLQPYMMMLAPTGGGKESALKSVRTFCERLGISDNHASGFQSWHALRDRLGIDPVLCWLWTKRDENLKALVNRLHPIMD